MNVNQKHLLSGIVLGVALLGSLMLLSQDQAQFDRVSERGKIKFVTRMNDSVSQPVSEFDAWGLEQDLATRFAESLGLEASFHEAYADQIIPMLQMGKVDIAAAGLAITDDRLKQIRFGPHYHMVKQQLVGHRAQQLPLSIDQIASGALVVVAGSSQAQQLQTLQLDFPGLQWREVKNKTTEDLLLEIVNGEVLLTVADSDVVARMRQYYPELSVAFDLTQPRSIAWAFHPDVDARIYELATEFFQRLISSGELGRIMERYYGHVEHFSYWDNKTFLERIDTTLPKYHRHFIEIAQKYDLDWRMLAAISYQESHWDEDARSHTGVRGLMMLTKNTAKQLGIADRTDPVQSIEGGARYLKRVMGRIPERIAMPDRLWFTLAAYNVGFGHLEDARILTQKQGGDPDSWLDVKKRLPLLREKKWHQQTKHGFARGDEPVRFVKNIRRYYDILVWHDRPDEPLRTADKTWRWSFIDSPVL